MERLYKRADERHPAEFRMIVDNTTNTLIFFRRTPGNKRILARNSSFYTFSSWRSLANVVNKKEQNLLKAGFILVSVVEETQTDFVTDVIRMISAENTVQHNKRRRAKR